MNRLTGYACCLLLLSCGQKFSADPTFRIAVTASNPTKAYRVSLIVRTNPEDHSQGLFHLAQSGPGVPVYRQPGVVRKRLMDTLVLTTDDFATICDVANRDAAWTAGDSYGERSDGTKYEIEVVERSIRNRYVVMGQSLNHQMQLPVSMISLFESYYDTLSLAMGSSSVALTRIDIGDTTDSFSIRLEKVNERLLLNGHDSLLHWQEYCDVWQIFENNHVWNLIDRMEYHQRYPIEYRFQIRLDESSLAWKVFAPSRLEDLRYFRIINGVEVLASRMANER